MAKGISPLRLFMRSTSKKSAPDQPDGTSSTGPEPSVSTTPQRHPLCPIPESLRNPLTPPQSMEQSPADAAASIRSKADSATPRAKAKLSFNAQEKYPHLENSEGAVNVGPPSGTPDKNATGPSSSKSKYSWQTHHPSSVTTGSGSRCSPAQARVRAQQENVSVESGSDVYTPPRGSKQSSADGNQVSSGVLSNSNTVNQQQSVPNSARAAGSTQTTPKSSRAARSGYDSESGLQGGTPGKSVSRALKYGQTQPSSSNAGTAGLANVRSTGSQHVITRTMGILPAVRGAGAGCQISNQNFVEQQFDLEEDPSFWSDHNVQVLIRTRPISSSELASQGSSRCLRQESPHTLTWLGQPESRYTFDHVAGEAITQEKLFKVAGLPMVENCMSGYNSCMFAYGQTGSGKTHTMLGDIDDLDLRPSDKRGMTPRVFEYLFSKIQMEQESRRTEQLKYFCKCSFLEIYNEQITDLLEPTSTNLQLREDAKKGVYVENLSEVEVQGVQDVIQLLLQGAANRKVASTNMNRESSRSHSVFTCIVESKWESNAMTNSRYGRLHLVDLAGSERQKSSGAEGGRLKEAANINKSLSTLGLVIMILVDVANGKQRHVPYRDSKLTFLLQDSLGGNSKTIMIANVSPSSCCAMETLSTLKFAQRAKFIRNNAVINEDASGDVIVLRQQIQELKVEVDRLRRESISRTPSMRFGSSLQNGSIDCDSSGENVDSGAVNSHSPDSAHVKTKAYIIEKKLKGMEAVLAGALRREQVAEDVTKKLAAEIEQLNRLVHQREEDSQCSKMMLRFREDKIRRLEGVADGVLSAEYFYKEEQKSLMDELQLIRARIDRNPELTRFAMENIRLMEQLRRYQEFYDCGEKAVLLEEISGLRNQLLDVLDAKLGEEQGQLTTPQKRALAPEIAARARENELLLIEVEGYQKEVKECRTNLNNCLVANAELTRQVDQMQAMITQLKAECSGKQKEIETLKFACDEERALGSTNQERSQSTIEELRSELRKNEERWDIESKLGQQLEEQLQTALRDAENLRAELESSKQWVSSDGVAEKLHSTEVSPATTQIHTEAEEIALQQRQSLTSVQEAAMIWRFQEAELRSQLKDAQDLIEKLSARLEQDSEMDVQSSILAEDVGKEPSQGRRQKLQELEMRHSEEVTRLQLELESVEDVLKEEQQQRLEATKKVEELTEQMDEATSKAEHGQSLVEALEGQQLFSLYELEKMQAELTRVSSLLKESESEVLMLEDKLQDMARRLSRVEGTSSRSERAHKSAQNDPAYRTLELKLEKARREREEVRAANERFQVERASRIAHEKEMELTRSEVETETALALTSMQSEIFDLREELAAAVESEAFAKLEFLQLKHELENLGHQNQELQASYETVRNEKDAEIRNLQKDWEGATAKLIDYLAEGDEELIEAAKEMDDMIEDSFSPRLVGAWKELDSLDHASNVVSKKQKAFELLYQHLQDAQYLARETEESVRALDEVSPQHRVAQDVINDLEKKSMAAFVLVKHLLDRIKELNVVNASLLEEKREADSNTNEKNSIIEALQQKLEDDLSNQELIAGQYEVLVEGHDRLRIELEDAVRESAVLKFQVENLELKLSRSYDLIEQVEGLVIDAEKQVGEVEGRALACLERAAKDEQVMLEREQVVVSLMSEFDEILASISQLEVSSVGFESAANVLQGGVSKVRDLEEDVVTYRSAIRALQSKLSFATTTLELKVEELDRARQENEASQLALKEEVANNQKWIEERAVLAKEKEYSLQENVGKEKLVTSLRAEVQTLEVNLKHAESKISEMLLGFEALTIATAELESERDRLIIASQQAEKNCIEKEQALVQIQADLCQLQERVREAEIREQVISMRMEELSDAQEHWDSEKIIVKQEIEDMKAEKLKLASDIRQLNAEVEKKEHTMFETLGRSQQAVEESEMKLAALDEELKNLEIARGKMEQYVTELELAASVNVHRLEEREKNLIELQEKFEMVQVQMMDMQKSLDSVNLELKSERISWMSEKERFNEEKESLRQEYLNSEAQLTDQLAIAETKLSTYDTELKSVTASFEQLSALKTDVELELAKVNKDALSTISNLKLREEELEDLRAVSDVLGSRCAEAEGRVQALQNALQQYALSEETWKAEKMQLVEKLKEVESMSASLDQANQENVAEFRDLSCNEDVPQQHIQRLKVQVEGLRRKLADKDNTILSARKEMEIAIANLREAELEMDKLQAENVSLRRTCEENEATINEITKNLKAAEEDVNRRQAQIEAFEEEMQKVGDIVSDWEVKILEAESTWKSEKEELVKEVDSAKLEAREKGLEAAVLNQKFQDSQVTLMEAEVLVNLLVRANETAKHNAQDWKWEKEALNISQGVWEPEKDRLVAAINCLKMEMKEREEETLSIFRDTAAELSEATNMLSSIQEEVCLLSVEHEQQMQILSDAVKDIKSEFSQIILLPKELGLDLGTFCGIVTEVKRTIVEVTNQNASLCEDLLASETRLQEQLSEMEALKAKLAVSALELETKCWDLQAAESNEAKNTEILLSLEQQTEVLEGKLVAALSEASELRDRLLTCESEIAALHNDLNERSNEVEDLERKVTTGDDVVSSLNERVRELTAWKVAAEENLLLLRKEVSDSEANLAQVQKDLLEQRNDFVVQREKLEELECASGEMEIMIHNLNDTIQQLSTERSTAEDSLSQLKVEITNAEANIELLKEELEEGRNEAESLELELSQLRAEKENHILAVDAKSSAIDSNVRELKAEIKDNQSHIQFLEQRLALAHSEVDDYVEGANSSIFELTVERDALQACSTEQSAALRTLDSEIEKLSERISLLDLELDATRNALDVRDRLVADKEEAIVMLHRQLQAANTDNAALSDIVAGLQVEIIEAEAKIIQLEAEVEECKVRLNDFQLEKDESVQSLSAEKNALHVEMVGLNALLVSLKDEILRLRADVAEHEERKAKSDSELEMTLKALETESPEDSVGMSHLHVRVSQLKDDLENERSTVKDLREKLVRPESDTTELINQLEAQLIIQSTALIGLEEEIIASKEDVSRKQASFETATTAMKENLEEERNRVRCLEEKLAMAEKENTHLNETLHDKVQELRAERDQFQVKASQDKVELEEGMRTVKDLEEKLAATEQDHAELIHILEEKCRRLIEERDLLQTQVDEEAASQYSLQQEMELIRESAVKEKNSEEKLQIQEFKKKCKSLIKENDELKCEMIELEGKLLDREEEIERRKKAVVDVEAKLNREKEKISKQERCQSIEHQGAQEAVERLQVKNKELEDMKANVEQLMQENGSLKLRLSDLEGIVTSLEEDIEMRKDAFEELEEKLICEEEMNSKQQALLGKRLQTLQVETDLLQRELAQQLDLQKRLKEELKNAEMSQETVSDENDRLQTCVSKMEQSHNLFVRDVFTQALVGAEGFRSAEIELGSVGEEFEEVQMHSENILFGNIEVSQEELCHATSAIHELRGQMKGLLDLTSATETIVCKKLALIESLQQEMLLKDKHLVELVADQATSVEEIKNERRWVSKQLNKILKKMQGVSSVNRTAALSDLESVQRVGDREYTLNVYEQQVDSIVEGLERVLLENTRMKSEFVTVQSRMENLEGELNQKMHDVKHLSFLEEELHRKEHEMNRLREEQVRHVGHSADVLTVHKHEIEILQQTLLNTVELFEHTLSQPPDLSSLLQEVSLIENVIRSSGLQRMFENLKEEIYNLQHTAAELQLRCSALEEELDERRNHVDLLADDLMLQQENSIHAIQSLKDELKAAEMERDKFQTDVVVLTEQLEMSQTTADEREIVAAEARQIAELSKSHAEKKEEEARILERSVEELESTVYALESQLGIVKRESERQRRAKEDAESDLVSAKQQLQLMKITIDRQDAQTARDMEDAKTAKTELDRMVIEMKNQQMQTRQTVESLQQECAEKDVQLRSCKAHIAELMSGAEKQASENQQKLKALESMVEQLKMEERKVNAIVPVVSKSTDSKNAINRPKGSGSPFKCIGSGLVQQRTSEIDEELSSARKRIRELEAIAAARQKEVFMLNTKLAEAESMTHDVVRDLLGVKMDIASYATLLNQQQVQQIADKARRRTAEAHQKEEELERLRDRLDELITERESWLDEINRRQAEAVTARVSAEKLRLRDSLLANENEKLKVEVVSLRKKVSDLEEEYRKLSGQQNLQQRIHHHAKIKEENNALKTQNEDLSGKLRRTEILFTRVNDELARYRNAEGKTPFLNFDEEDRLRKKLQETEENRLQLAQNFVSLCTAIIQAAGVPRTSRDPDAATAMSALLQLQDRLEAMERELLDLKLKARIANEKRRMSDLREQHTPRKSAPTNFTATQQITSPDTSSR
ncbi:kinesin family member 15 [Marchantia polymorpha subsp. ruderalis]|uniref:Kinesin motor domain-containing protein n=2 Tax=Marchantia polymorpha TaxID=3197 RepID=A0AAF6AKK7_MARPO|nr:hypothetical protein MARPO_0029s0045 [Marchantia polymorpha]BBM96977.1 hypothetical protein Mp_1g02010 [Marchantia polymorpha subsp. ruderalis]|eukprot:PTQ42504.1 hypothetical protein MARPO_0029s0045 [Marchantia polymorpha]